jgi:hypothetical protein
MHLVQEEYYSSEYTDYHKTKSWFEPDKKEGYSTWESRELEENFDDYFAKYPLIYKRALRGEGIYTSNDKKEVKQTLAMNMGYINQNRAHKLLFKTMEDNILGWWD